jgi:hypothetical protein
MMMTTNQIFCIRQILKKSWSTVEKCIRINTEKASDSFRREVLYIILAEYDKYKKLGWLIQTCLNETCCKVDKAKHFCGSFSIQNEFEQGDILQSLLLKFIPEIASRMVQENQDGLKLSPISYWSVLIMIIFWAKL